MNPNARTNIPRFFLVTEAEVFMLFPSTGDRVNLHPRHDFLFVRWFGVLFVRWFVRWFSWGNARTIFLRVIKGIPYRQLQLFVFVPLGSNQLVDAIFWSHNGLSIYLVFIWYALLLWKLRQIKHNRPQGVRGRFFISYLCCVRSRFISLKWSLWRSKVIREFLNWFAFWTEQTI